jgi:hypothetical protein
MTTQRPIWQQTKCRIIGRRVWNSKDITGLTRLIGGGACPPPNPIALTGSDTFGSGMVVFSDVCGWWSLFVRVDTMSKRFKNAKTYDPKCKLF